MTESLVQATIPFEMGKIVGLQSQSRSQAETSTQVFLKSSIRNFRGADATSPLSYKAVMLEYSRPKKEKVKRRSKGSRMNAAQKRRMKLFTIRPEHQRYELFLPLHHLWRQYITDVCGGLKPTSSPQFLQQKLLKADLHGAVLSVVRSRCPSYVGTTGILVQEFKHVFKIITKENKVKVIPKRNSVFSLEMGGFTSFIYGSRFEQRASERSAKKFKVRGTIDL
ncbi:ribonuclease P protein subunit p29 isoform X3 [Takifugu flavidus]|uniref:ribonuclease P protein subunit p29 isoform X2 n=1 Tax=Takifugu flavidus TaxID=433684 RepID=UPI002544594E|nr:ribonuclease P protein subunit p29 isoform X2 [Takifugu flavidus]XP_056876774.1 ribonuclease P protein subunit p29 isoform X3 [Takifugu flavidus]